MLVRKETLTTVTAKNFNIDINGVKIASILQQKLLGVTIDDQLTFKSHVCDMFKKASQIFSALTRIASDMDQNEWRIIMKAYINS